LTTDGAISLAEFLPETKSLLHLDLTSNPQIETAGILALSVGLKSNTLIRCLDLSIPPNSPDLAELSQSILQSCIRNTELAADTAKPGPGQDAVWQPIKKSSLVKDVKAADRARQDRERAEIANSSEGQAREFVYTLKPERLVPQGEELVEGLERWFTAGEVYKRPGFRVWEPSQLPRVEYEVMYERAKILRERVVDRIQEDPGAEELDKLLGVNDALAGALEKGGKFEPPPRLLLPSQIVNSESANIQAQAEAQSRPEVRQSNSNSNANTNHSLARGPPGPNGNTPAGLPRSVRRHMRIPSLEISSPNFSIGDSDNESDADAEEVDVGSFSQPSGSGSGNELEGGVVGLGMGGEGEGQGVGHEMVERASRAWVEEEGEIFRKGMKLGVADEVDDDDEGEGEVSGEQLKQEVSHEFYHLVREALADDRYWIYMSRGALLGGSSRRAMGMVREIRRERQLSGNEGVKERR
jgi:protein phosphatase 1 regulatory subunit 37